MTKFISKVKSWDFILLGILLLATLLRFYNFPNRYGFDSDAIRDVNVAYYAATHFFFPLTGPFSSAGPFTFGPFYYYFLSFSYYLFPSAFAPWILISILSVVTVFVMYKAGEALGGKVLGYITGLLAALSASEIQSGTGVSNLNFVPFLSAVSLFLLLIIIQDKKKIWSWASFLLGVSLGLCINMHYQSAGLLVFPVIVLLYKGIANWRKIVLFSVGIFLTAIPLLVFNLLHNWHTVRGILYSYEYVRKAIYVPNSWSIYLKSFWPALWANMLGVPVWMGILFMALCIGLFLFKVWKKQYSFLSIILIIGFMINFISLRYYWGERHFVYFEYLQPLVILFSAYVLYFLYKLVGKNVLIPLILLLGIVIFINDIPLLQSDGSHMQYIADVRQLTKQYPQKQFHIFVCNTAKNKASAQTYAYLLSYNHKLSPSGVQIGIFGYRNTCDYPPTAGFMEKTATFSAQKASMYYPTIENTSMVALSRASSSALHSAKWDTVSGQTIYKNVAEWWY